MIPGVGIAPTYTISRTVLSDAVALVRGDRFYTVSPPNKLRRLVEHGLALSPGNQHDQRRLSIVAIAFVGGRMLTVLDRLQSQEPDELGLQGSPIRSEHQSGMCLLQVVPSSIPEPLQA
jgi:hypothetical protein